MNKAELKSHHESSLRQRFALFQLRHGRSFFLDAPGVAARMFVSDRGEHLPRPTLHAWMRRGWLEDTLTETTGRGARMHYEVTDRGLWAAEKGL